MKNIRNFAIIAHIDHGKSTISDRLIQFCGGLNAREMSSSSQILDSMDIERERGITIKAQNVTLQYKSSSNAATYQLNFIDTPGHVDFAYEVSRSLAACEGVLLLVDAVQGVEAQTLANCYKAIEMNLEIVIALNKIDLPTADPEKISKEIEDIIGINSNNAIYCSAKTGLGIPELLEHLVLKIPPPQGNINTSLQALIIDSWFDNYLGVISLVRVKNGIIRKGSHIKIMSTGQSYYVDHLGVFTPKRQERNELKCGEIGWLTCALKNISGAPVGDTITSTINEAIIPLPGFQKVKPQVYAGLFPIKSDDYISFQNALGKLSLNDSSLFYETESSSALGFGFRCGFLGLLHLEIIQERLEREYNINLITTAPTVIYEIKTNLNKILYIDNPSKFPNQCHIKEIREPIAECHIISPKEYLGNIIELCTEKRGIQINMVYHYRQIEIIYEIPIAEIVLDFFNRLKSVSKGYASLDYNFKCFKISDIICVDILVNAEKVDALALITHRDKSIYYSKKLVNKIKELIPRQQFDIIIQATIGNHIIARSTIKQLRKNVIAKCYGGDISRKKKLLQKQKEGKKRMKQIGNVEIPQTAFLAILKVANDG